jgi:hypothetical protein
VREICQPDQRAPGPIPGAGSPLNTEHQSSISPTTELSSVEIANPLPTAGQASGCPDRHSATPEDRALAECQCCHVGTPCVCCPVHAHLCCTGVGTNVEHVGTNVEHVGTNVEHVVCSPSVTHGKNGVPPLPAMPDPENLPVRRCAGAPGWDCDAILGPEVPGTLCDHCANYLRSVRAEEDAVSETVGADAERAAQREAAVMRETHASTLALLVEMGHVTRTEANEVGEAVAGLASAIDRYVQGYTWHQQVVFLVLLRDLVSTLVQIHKLAAAGSPRGGGQ